MLANGASKMHNGVYDHDDLLQAALLGAVIAAHMYDEEHESSASFNTYAIWRMKQEISNVWRKSGPAHITKRDYEAMPKSQRVVHLCGYSYMSDPVKGADEGITLEHTLSAPAEPDELSKTDVQKTVNRFLAQVSPAERDMITKVYGFQTEPMTIVDAAQSRGISRQRGWQVLSSGLTRIRRMCQLAGVNPAWLAN